MDTVYLVEFLVCYLCEPPYFFHGCGGSDFIVVVFEWTIPAARVKLDKGALPEVSSWAPDFWRLSRKHFRVVLGDGRLAELTFHSGERNIRAKSEGY
jgi:hypothetical protein